HAARLGAEMIREIDVVRGLEDALPRGAILVVAARILELAVHVIAGGLAERRGGAADFRVQGLLVPGPRREPDLALRFCHVRAGFGARGFRLEVEVAPHLRRAVNRRGRPTHHVDAVTRCDRLRIVAGILDSPDTAEIVLASGTADVEGSRD